MLLEMAAADAYGLGFEFVPDTPDRPNDLSRYHQHPKYADLRPGMYSDDTLRALANAHVLLEGDVLDPQSYATAYVRAHRGDPRKGWSKRFQALLEGVAAEERDDVRAGRLLLLRTDRRASSNGAIMGVAPLGFLPEPRMVALAAAAQAMSTHGIETVPYAQATALVAHFHLHSVQGDVDDFVADHVGTHDVPDWRGHAHVRTDMSARNTYKAIRRANHLHASLSAIMRWAVSVGGDTDSVAATAVAIAACRTDVVRDVPDHLFETLETPARRAGIEALEASLRERFPSGGTCRRRLSNR